MEILSPHIALWWHSGLQTSSWMRHHLAFRNTCSITARFCSTFTSSFMSVPPKMTPKGSCTSAVKSRNTAEMRCVLQDTGSGYLQINCSSDKLWEPEECKHLSNTFTQEKSASSVQMNGQCTLERRILRQQTVHVSRRLKFSCMSELTNVSCWFNVGPEM